MTIEREVLPTDILIVGAGPAGLAVAYKLAELVAADSPYGERFARRRSFALGSRDGSPRNRRTHSRLHR